jgi:integrase
MSMGSVRKRGKTWIWYLDIGPDPLTGRRRQTSKGGFKAKKAAQEDLNTAIAKRQRGELAKRSKRTVRDFLEDEWLPTVDPTRRPSTAANYRTNIKVHVVPLIGDVRLQALSPVQLNAFYAKLQADHRRDGQPLAPKSVRNIHAMLHKALKDALRWGLVTRNVADAVDAPNGLSPEMHAWTAAQLRAFLAHARHDRLFAAWMLFATTGMRRGEVAGLRDVDLDLTAGWVAPRRPRVVVNHRVHLSDPKTVAGRRLLALDPATVAALREHLEQRKAERAQLAEWGLQVEASACYSREGRHAAASRPVQEAVPAAGGQGRVGPGRRAPGRPAADPAARRAPHLRDRRLTGQRAGQGGQRATRPCLHRGDAQDLRARPAGHGPRRSQRRGGRDPRNKGGVQGPPRGPLR